MKIEDINLKTDILLAPMAGVTDAPFRAICSRFGYGLAYTEMVSAKALMYNDRKTIEILQKAEEEPQPAVQIFGSDIEAIRYAVNYLNNTETPLIDINMGCPTPKITKNGEGSALMKHPCKASKIIETAAKASDKPVTVKIRSGWDKDSMNYLEFARMAEQSGVAAIAVHPRTRNMHYSGKADWDVIKKVKQTVRVPIIGNGDIFSGQDALEMLEKTGCDAVMVARGAMGNPWIFREYHSLKNGEDPVKPSISEKKLMIAGHFDLLVKYKGMHRAVLEIRKHAAWYAHGEHNAAKFRRKVFTCTSREEVLEALEMLE
jgi:nifR3 family TIM-barrel protein